MHSFRLKFAIRALLRNKSYMLLNVMGLAIGLGVSIVIFLYLQDELTYDTHVPNYREIYRVTSNVNVNGNTEEYAVAGYGFAPLLQREYAFIEGATRLKQLSENVLFKWNGLKVSDNNIALADSNFFTVFRMSFISGDRYTALSQPHSMVVTESFARKLFGERDPVGEIISTNNNDYTITGLIKDIPTNAHHRFSAVISAFHSSYEEEKMRQSLWTIEFHTFLRLDRSYEPELLLREFKGFYDRYMKDAGEELEAGYSIALTRLDKIHFAPPVSFDRPSGDKRYLYAFGAIGLIILTLACINYVNIATIRSLKKVKEAGMQKILGAGKREIIYQMFIESFILSLLALAVSFVLVELVLELTPLNKVIGKDLALDFALYPVLWWLPFTLAAVIAFLSGWYPAVYLSRVPALAAVKRGMVKTAKGVRLRKVLVGFQFVISVSVVITALLMYRQMEFLKNKDLGFNKEDVVLIPIQDTITMKKVPEIQKKLTESKYIKASSTANVIPGKTVDRILVKMQQGDSAYVQQMVDFMMVGYNYFQTMEIRLTEGETFSEDYFRTEEGYPVIINNAVKEAMGWKHPIGKKLQFVVPGREEDLTGVVIGVVEDFNAHSLHQKIEPTIITLQEENVGYIYIRVDSGNLQAALSDIESTFALVRPENPFQFSFLNEDLMQQYEEEQRQSRLILFLTYLAIFISFLGLTGLASFTTSLRTREVGIRKILGADLRQVVGMIFKDMLLLVVISVVLAIPIAYFLITQWLSNFAFTAPLDPAVFLLSGLLAIILAYFIISYHSIKIARTKPIETLRYE